MTKPIKKNAKPYWYGEWIKLSDQQCQDLLDQLGYDFYTENEFKDHIANLEEDEKADELELSKKSEQVLTNVRYYISAFEQAEESLDYAPRGQTIGTI